MGLSLQELTKTANRLSPSPRALKGLKPGGADLTVELHTTHAATIYSQPEPMQMPIRTLTTALSITAITFAFAVQLPANAAPEVARPLCIRQ